MKDIISEFYKKVLGFFNNEVKEENSKDTACNRLKLVLMQDRAKMEPALMEKMREEMINVISKYVEIDKEALDLNLEAEGESFALMLNIPVLRAKTREEVEAAEGIISDDDDDDNDESLELEDEEDNDYEIVEDNQDDVEESEDVEQQDGESIELVEEENSSQEIQEDNNEENSSLEKESSVTEKPSTRKKKSKHQKDDDL